MLIYSEHTVIDVHPHPMLTIVDNYQLMTMKSIA